MSLAALPIYAPPRTPIRLGWKGRFGSMLAALAMLAPLVIGSTLTPAAGGVGTHRQLGWAPCSSLLSSGVPCPSCGMTTSVAWFARGNWVASFYLQPAAWVLAVVLACGFWIAAYVAVTGRPVHRLLSIISLKWALLAGAAVVLIGWGWKVLLHSRGLDGW